MMTLDCIQVMIEVKRDECRELAITVGRRKVRDGPMVPLSGVIGGTLIGTFQFDVRSHCRAYNGLCLEGIQIAGDGSTMADNRCTNCITWNMDCTYMEAAKVCTFSCTIILTFTLEQKRGPPKG